MGRSVTITTPIPTLEEVGKRLKMSKARQRRLIEIVRSSSSGRFVVRHRSRPGPVEVHVRSGSSVTTESSQAKKSKRAAAAR